MAAGFDRGTRPLSLGRARRLKIYGADTGPPRKTLSGTAGQFSEMVSEN